MAGDWYYSNGDKVTGPLPAAALRQAALSGEIGPRSLVRQGASGKWHSALKVKGLLDSSSEPGASIKSTPAASKPVPTAAVQDGIEEDSGMDSGVEIEVVEVVDDSWDDPDFGVDDLGSDNFEPIADSFVVPRRLPKPNKIQKTAKKAATGNVHPAVWAALASFCTVVITVPATLGISVFLARNPKPVALTMSQESISSPESSRPSTMALSQTPVLEPQNSAVEKPVHEANVTSPPADKPKFNKAIFDPLYRVTTELRSAQDIGLARKEFSALLQQFSTEVAIATDKAQTEKEREVCLGYRDVLQIYKDSATIWDVKIAIPRLLEQASEEFRFQPKDPDRYRNFAGVGIGNIPVDLYPSGTTGLESIAKKYSIPVEDWKGYRVLPEESLQFVWRHATARLDEVRKLLKSIDEPQ